MSFRLEVRRDDAAQCRLVDLDDAARPPAAGEVCVRIDALGLTSNNVTYAAFGEAMRYWQFYPTGDAAWGCVPAWGFGTVEASAAEGVAVGERLYGFWPMAERVRLQAARVGPGGFSDGSAHRAGLPALYNRVLRCAADPLYRADREAEQALLVPLFFTAFLLEDFLAEAAYFGARQVLVSSASSKTAWSTAHCMRARTLRHGGALRLVGLTSAAHADDVRALGCYDDVLGYDDVTRLDPQVPSVYVDFAGHAGVRAAVHGHFGDWLRHSAAVGSTHLGCGGGARGLPGPRPTLFFAPAQHEKRRNPPPDGWGRDGLQARLGAAWHGLLDHLGHLPQPWLQVREAQGAPAWAEAWRTAAAGRIAVREGLILRPA